MLHHVTTHMTWLDRYKHTFGDTRSEYQIHCVERWKTVSHNSKQKDGQINDISHQPPLQQLRWCYCEKMTLTSERCPSKRCKVYRFTHIKLWLITTSRQYLNINTYSVAEAGMIGFGKGDDKGSRSLLNLIHRNAVSCRYKNSTLFQMMYVPYSAEGPICKVIWCNRSGESWKLSKSCRLATYKRHVKQSAI